MTTLKFADTHNMVAFLSKPAKSDGFEEIVDFLNAQPIRYALTVNPTIYISCIEQFWSTGVVKTINGEVQLHALVDGKKIIISEASVRRDLKLEDEEGMIRKLDNVSGKFLMYPRRVGKGFSGRVTPLFLSMVVQHQSQMGEGSANPTDPHHTPTIIQPSTQPQKTQKPRKPKRKDTQVSQPSDPSDNVADKAVHKELGDSLVRDATTASSLEAEQDSESSGNEEDLGEDEFKQGRRINAIDADEDITLVNVQDDVDNEMFDVDALNVSIAATTVTITSEEITLAQVLEALKTSKPKVKGIVFQEPGKSTTTTTIISSQQSQDKGKGIIIEEPVKPMKKKYQISFDEEVALKLQVEFDEEERLAREKVKKEKEANIALIEEWDDSQEKIDADYQLAERLQAQEQEELSVEEKAKLFQQLLEQRRKHFAAKSAEEKRNKPPTQAQQRKIMCTYLKNMEGKKLKDLKNKSFDSIQKMFDRAFKRVNTFVDFRTDLVEGSSKRAGEELEQESTKKQKVDEDKDTAELQSLMEVIPDEEEVAIDVVPLATKSPKIVDWKIHKEGKKSYYQIVRADGKSQMYMIFSQMLKSFDREDLEDLYKLVKARYGSTRPVESMDYLLWNDLKTMFEPHVEDAIWRNQQGYKVLEWKLYDSCGVHSLMMQSMQIYMLVEKRYPLTPPTITDMLNKKLQVDYFSKMAYQLLKHLTKQLKNQ
ncbi:hypothetical protein Tco_0765800 [Tanacetum coccineum]